MISYDSTMKPSANHVCLQTRTDKKTTVTAGQKTMVGLMTGRTGQNTVTAGQMSTAGQNPYGIKKCNNTTQVCYHLPKGSLCSKTRFRQPMFRPPKG